MAEEHDSIVLTDRSGTRASARLQAGQSVVIARLDDGREVALAADLLEKRGNAYFVPIDFEEHATAAPEPRELVIPIVEEQLAVTKKTVVSDKVRITKRVQEEERVFSVPLKTEALKVKRVPINRIVQEPAVVRHEDGRLIVPVHEERLIVQKQLVLVEELHIDREVTAQESVQTVVVRREVLDVERTQNS